MAVITLNSSVFTYLYDNWKFNSMWERCQETDMVGRFEQPISNSWLSIMEKAAKNNDSWSYKKGNDTMRMRVEQSLL